MKILFALLLLALASSPATAMDPANAPTAAEKELARGTSICRKPYANDKEFTEPCAAIQTIVDQRRLDRDSSHADEREQRRQADLEAVKKVIDHWQ